MNRTQKITFDADSYQKLHTVTGVSKLKILRVLLISDKPVSVLEIQRQTGFRQDRTSHHLAALRRYGIVKRKKQGKSVVYRLTDAAAVYAVFAAAQAMKGG